MLNSKPLKDILFIDIETVPQYESFFDMPERKQLLFKEKFNREIDAIRLGTNGNEDLDRELKLLYIKQASFLPELGKIVCISVGKFLNPKDEDETLSLKTASFTGENDKDILVKFISSIVGIKDCTDVNKATIHLCAHYGKVFDFPFIAKRLLLNRLPLPAMFDYGHLKPWELTYMVDTIDAWRFGRMDCNASLDMIADSFGIESPKLDMSGKDVKDVFYKEKDLPKIAKYCESDIMALAQIYIRMKGDFREVIKSK